MTKIFLICIGLMSNMTLLYSQDADEKSGFDPSKIVVGGNAGINTSNSILSISISPQVSYPIFPKLYVGLGPNISYVQNLKTSANALNYGANAFSKFFITNDIYAQIESELMNYESGIDAQGTAIRKWTNSLLLGAGYNKNLGNGLNASFTVLYIVNYNANTSPYNSPIVLRGGINKSF